MKYSDSQIIDWLQDTNEWFPSREELIAEMNGQQYRHSMGPFTGVDPVPNRISPPGPDSPNIPSRASDKISPIGTLVPWDTARYLREKAAEDAAKKK